MCPDSYKCSGSMLALRSETPLPGMRHKFGPRCDDSAFLKNPSVSTRILVSFKEMTEKITV